MENKLFALILFTITFFHMNNGMDLSKTAPKADDMISNALEHARNNKNANEVMRPDEKHASSNLHSFVDVKSSVHQTVECTLTNGNTVVSIVTVISNSTQNSRGAKKEVSSKVHV